MADHAEEDDDGDEDIFVYRGGRAPQHINHARIDGSLHDIEDSAFENCKHLLTVETHDGIRKIGKRAFVSCKSLRRINLKSVVEIDDDAFNCCYNLADVEFGDRLETIGQFAFNRCSLPHLKLPSTITIGQNAFWNCKRLQDIDFSERLETIGGQAFWGCERLRRIAVPLKRDLFEFSDVYQRYSQFDRCEQLATVDLVGGIHKTVASLHMESWRAEMIIEINRINQVLPNTPFTGKANEIRQWMDSVMDNMDHYKAEHCRYVKEGITLLELALWKANLAEKDNKDGSPEERQTKKAKVDAKAARKDRRITCGADMVIKNVLPFLQLE